MLFCTGVKTEIGINITVRGVMKEAVDGSDHVHHSCAPGLENESTRHLTNLKTSEQKGFV